MKLLSLFIFILASSSVWSVPMMTQQLPTIYLNTGIEWRSDWTQNTTECLKVHNMARVCWAHEPETPSSMYMYKPASCLKGPTEQYDTDATIIKCVSSPVYQQANYNCPAIRKKFMNGEDVCNISQNDWAANYECYGEDQRAIRAAQCPKGCDGVPNYHVCDWTEEQYYDYKNCSSVKLITQQTRETICPTGMPDVDEQGPPPRIKILKDRAINHENYLSYHIPVSNGVVRPLKIEISSLASGTLDPKYCYTLLSNTTTTCTPNQTFGSNQDNKSIIELNSLAVGKYVLVVKNGLGKTSTIYFDVTSSEIGQTPSGNGLWVELFGPDLSPILPAGDYGSNTYENQPCYQINLEQKDASGRRWKCLDLGGGATPAPPQSPSPGPGGPMNTPAPLPSAPTYTGYIPTCEEVKIDLCIYGGANNILKGYSSIRCGCGNSLPNNANNDGCAVATVMGPFSIGSSQAEHCPGSGTFSHATKAMSLPSGMGWKPPPNGQFVYSDQMHMNAAYSTNAPYFESVKFDEFIANYQQVRLGQWQAYCTWAANNQIDCLTGASTGTSGSSTSPYYQNGVYNYTGYTLGSGTSGCEEYPRCNSYGVRYDLMICSGGATPVRDPSNPDKWQPFVFPGQFIYYPEQTSPCDPTAEEFQIDTGYTPDPNGDGTVSPGGTAGHGNTTQ